MDSGWNCTPSMGMLVAQAHDRAVFQPGGDFQQSGRRGAVDDERVIAGRLEGRGQAAEHALTGMVHGAHLAVHDLVAAHDLAAERLADGLVAEADAKKRDAGLGGGLGQRQADPA
jgi:hypothetical protein